MRLTAPCNHEEADTRMLCTSLSWLSKVDDGISSDDNEQEPTRNSDHLSAAKRKRTLPPSSALRHYRDAPQNKFMRMDQKQLAKNIAKEMGKRNKQRKKRRRLGSGSSSYSTVSSVSSSNESDSSDSDENEDSTQDDSRTFSKKALNLIVKAEKKGFKKHKGWKVKLLNELTVLFQKYKDSLNTVEEEEEEQEEGK